ncbi:MAG: hypothetical protein JWO07_34 [Candidatus Saccharibacteria bacterium]|nr:hypothetical protein [Candidatus Saccharibacteria bacterium]
MSIPDTEELIKIISAPAASFTSKKAAVDPKMLPGLIRHSFSWRWGGGLDAHRLRVTIKTVLPPVAEQDGSTTVFYSPMCCAITIGRTFHRDHYTGVGVYSFNYDEQAPKLPRKLAMAFRPLSSPVPGLHLPCAGGF